MKILKTTLEAIAIFTIFFIMPGLAGNIETHYNREGIVTSAKNDVIMVEDNTGNIWAFDGYDYEVGDVVKMRMFTNYTDNTIEDDEVENVKKIPKR